MVLRLLAQPGFRGTALTGMLNFDVSLPPSV
jgi:hypothetical protein